MTPEQIKEMAAKYAVEQYGEYSQQSRLTVRDIVHKQCEDHFEAGYTACMKERENLIWKMIEDFQEMMAAEGLDRDTEINKKHLSYNDVETYLYELLPSPPQK